jgi:hypothetical protein
MLTKILAAVAAALVIGGTGAYIAYDYYGGADHCGGCPLSAAQPSAGCAACEAADATACCQDGTGCADQDVCPGKAEPKTEASVEVK